MSKQNNPGQDTKQNKLSEALSTIAHEVLGGELQELRKSVASTRDDVQKRLDRDLESLRKDLFAKLEAISRRLEENEAAGKRSLDEMEERSKKSLDVMKQQVRDAQDQTSQSIAEAAKVFQADLSSREELLRNQVDAVGQRLNGVHGEVQQQMRRTEQLSSLMSGLATVFTNQPPAPGNAPATDPVRLDPDATLDEPSNPMSPSEKKTRTESERDEEFEEALEKVFED